MVSLRSARRAQEIRTQEFSRNTTPSLTLPQYLHTNFAQRNGSQTAKVWRRLKMLQRRCRGSQMRSTCVVVNVCGNQKKHHTVVDLRRSKVTSPTRKLEQLPMVTNVAAGICCSPSCADIADLCGDAPCRFPKCIQPHPQSIR